MSQLFSLPPVSPGIADAVRKLLEFAAESESEARKLCVQLWPKTDSDVIQVALAYWRLQAAPERTPGLSVIVTKIGTE